MISFEKKFIFTHIPKTGGTSISFALKDYKDDGIIASHVVLSKQIKKVTNRGENSDEYFKFAVIRNPWDLVVSNYFYIKSEKSYWHSSDDTTKFGKHPDYDFVKDLSFSEFVCALRDKKIKSRQNYKPQSFWVDGELDYIIKFEKLLYGYKEVCKMLNIQPVTLPHLNKTNHRSYIEYYNCSTYKIVSQIYKSDIKRFNFKYLKKFK